MTYPLRSRRRNRRLSLEEVAESKFKVGDLVECLSLNRHLYAVVIEVSIGTINLDPKQPMIFYIVRDEEGDICDFRQDDLKMVAPA